MAKYQAKKVTLKPAGFYFLVFLGQYSYIRKCDVFTRSRFYRFSLIRFILKLLFFMLFLQV